MVARRVRGDAAGADHREGELGDEVGERVEGAAGFEGADLLEVFGFEVQGELGVGGGGGRGAVGRGGGVGAGWGYAEIGGWIRGGGDFVEGCGGEKWGAVDVGADDFVGGGDGRGVQGKAGRGVGHDGLGVEVVLR